ncbi:MAG: hypothetical protein KBC22_02340 [Candidatus Pacebacteria bacterium]|nr:hypothetical protein [Candidatus Paceibacterota bacterium]
MNNIENTLFIIAGASGEIGDIFIQNLIKKYHVIGISRTTLPKTIHANLSWAHLDLTNPIEVQDFIDRSSFASYERVVFLHSIGVDKFENQNYPETEVHQTIDPVVYHSNVNTYKYIAAGLVEKIKSERESGSNTHLTLSMIGSVADKYGLIFLTSFTESKHIVRSYIQSAVRCYPWISGLVINITSTITASALKVRPHSDTTYWLTPEEVSKKSIKALATEQYGYKEIDIIKHNPDFEEDYYHDNEKIYKRWSHFVWGQN